MNDDVLDVLVTGDGELHPLLLDAVVRSLRRTFAAAQAETVRRVYATQPYPIVRTATVVDSDPDAGTVDVVVDGDVDPLTGAQNVAPAIVTGPVPPPDARALVLFVPGGGLYCLGMVGAAQIIVPDQTGGVSLNGDTQPLQVGSGDGTNLAVGGSSIQARTGTGADATPVALRLNREGGNVVVLNTAAIGRATSSLDTAVFAHADRMTAEDAGFRQQQDGDIIVNAPLGRSVQIRVDGATPALVDVELALGGQAYVRFPASLPTGPGTPLVYDGGDGSLRRDTSSVRYKTDVADVDDAAAVVAGLRARRYRRTDTDDGTVEVGFVAEEVDAVAPDAVARDADGHADAVRLAAIVARLVDVVQGLSARVAAIEGGA